MAAAANILAKKRASLRFEKAELNWLAGRVAGLDGRVGIALARKMNGGDWVDGEVCLSEDSLYFAPSGLSRLALKQGAQYERGIALSQVSHIQMRRHMLHQVIDLHLDSGETVSIRCYIGVSGFAAQLEEQVRHARA